MGNYDFELDLETVNTMSVINKWIQAETDVLEFGPANGRLTRYLSEKKKCRVTIVEIDEEAGKQAAQYAVKSYIGEKRGNIEQFCWAKKQEKYDYIIFADVLEHLSNPNVVIEACKQHLQPEGRILISIPNIGHNSVIIDLLNDRFDYSKVGLLDRTHVHFFTYSTFVEMIHECDFYICDMVPIYSRVGDNEVNNTYRDVPIQIAQYLRRRSVGSVYQYVFNISAKEGEKETAIEVKNLELDEYEELEAQCFFRKSDGIYDELYRVEKIYKENEKVFWEINISELEEAERIRLDPMERSGVVWLEQCMFTSENMTMELQIERTNALYRCGNLLIFDDIDPWIEFQELPQEYTNSKVILIFRIIEYAKEQKHYIELGKMLEKLGIKVERPSERKPKEQEEYIAHLEQDIKEQKEYIGHLEHDIGELKEYVRHLEKNIAELKSHIETLQNTKIKKKGV